MGTQVAERRYAREKGGVAPTAMESVAVAIEFLTDVKPLLGS
jgi:hypothetical protein